MIERNDEKLLNSEVVFLLAKAPGRNSLRIHRRYISPVICNLEDNRCDML